MKKLNIYIVFAAVLLASCKKSFLTENAPTAVQIASAIKTENDMADAVNGMYSTMRSPSSFGRDITALGDLLADNTYVSFSNLNHYTSENNYVIVVASTPALNIWTQSYYTILQANRIINAGIPVSATSNQLRGEAYTVRALSYLELVNFFGASYTISPNSLGVPIIKSFTSPFILPARNTVSEVYKQIISDLDSAYAIMPATAVASTFHATNSEYIAKYAARAIEARAYLYQGDYTNALNASLDVIQNGGYTLAASTGFNAYWANPAAQTGKLETIFEIALNTLTNNGTSGLDNLYAQAGSGDILATDPLYALYTATDVRKSLIINGTRASQPALIVNKYPNYSLSTDKDDIKIIRYAEVLLTAAESYSRNGDNTNALVYLNMVAQKRDPAFTGYTSTGAATLTNILNERRKELAFEGLRLFDLSRTNVVINRPVEPFSFASVNTIAVGDYRRIFPIPQTEMDANKNMVQNPGY